MTSGPVPWELARERAGGAADALPPRSVALRDAAGAVLAADARATTDLPATDTAAMDGWAVAGPPPWRPLPGQVLAGDLPAPLTTGTAVRIATGAVVPAGADGVLRRERALPPGDDPDGVLRPHGCGDPEGGASVARAVEAVAADVRRRGRECGRGEVVLPAGTVLRPAALGLLAAAGLDEVPVRRARVELLVLGDELLDSGPAREGRVRDALGPLLAAWLPALGVQLVTHRRLPDRAADLRSALEHPSPRQRADLVVTTGSTAHGPVDHVHAVLAATGARLVVDGVAVRPGHPQLLAVLPDGRPLVGLPGNPLAAVSGLLTLLEPLVRSLHGTPPPVPRHVALAEEVAAGRDATRLVPVRGDRPVLWAGPAMLRGLAAADGVAVVPPGGLPAGGRAELLALP